VGYKNNDFLATSRCISQTIRDSVIITIVIHFYTVISRETAIYSKVVCYCHFSTSTLLPAESASRISDQ